MAEPVKQVVTEVEPIKVILTKREDGPGPGTVVTPAGQPNVEVLTRALWKQVAVRGVRSFLQNFVGYLLGAGIGAGVAHAAEIVAAQSGIVIPPEAKTWMNLFIAAFFASLGPTIVCVAQNTLEILGKWDVNRPGLRA